MGINLQGNVLYIKRSSGLVPTYSFTGGLNNNTNHSSSSHLGIMTSGSKTASFISADDYNRTRENTSSKVLCIKNMIIMKEVGYKDIVNVIYCFIIY